MNHQLLFDAFARASKGSITITLPDNSAKKFTGSKAGFEADLKIYDLTSLDAVILGGDIAFGEGYMNGAWDSSDLSNLLCYIADNHQDLEDFFHSRMFLALWLSLKHFFRQNSKKGSKRNISEHYDLGNDFYQLWLDPSMTYSSALFAGQNLSLKAAQKAKYQEILQKIKGESILEIGCGWGGFAEIAAENGHQLKCLTISQMQHDYAKERLKKFGDSVKICLQDYRDEREVFDNVVSIEMFEAVGQKYWKVYFETLQKVLKVGGKAVLQIITIDEKVFLGYKKRVDFIQKHIFPGGVLPSKSAVRKLAADCGFLVKSELDFAADYAKTLQIWLENFDAKKSEILAMGFNEKFIRKWRFYLGYCIAGFATKRTDIVQFELERSR